VSAGFYRAKRPEGSKSPPGPVGPVDVVDAVDVAGVSGGFFERVHPVTKLIALVIAFVPPFFAQRPLQILPYFCLLLVAALATGAAPHLERLRAMMAILFIMSVLLWSLFYQGQTRLFGIGLLAVTLEGTLYGATVGIRLVCFILATVIFLACTRIEDFTYALSRLGVPYVASFTLSLAFRLTPLFMETGATIVMAQRARGLDLDSGGLIARLRRYVPILIPILVSGLRRADQLAVALESKGFGRRNKRTTLSEYPVTWRDAALLFAVLAVALICAISYYRTAGPR